MEEILKYIDEEVKDTVKGMKGRAKKYLKPDEDITEKELLSNDLNHKVYWRMHSEDLNFHNYDLGYVKGLLSIKDILTKKIVVRTKGKVYEVIGKYSGIVYNAFENVKDALDYATYLKNKINKKEN